MVPPARGRACLPTIGRLLQHLRIANGPARCSHKQIKGVNEKRIEWGEEVKLWHRLLRRIDKSLPEVLAVVLENSNVAKLAST